MQGSRGSQLFKENCELAKAEHEIEKVTNLDVAKKDLKPRDFAKGDKTRSLTRGVSFP